MEGVWKYVSNNDEAYLHIVSDSRNRFTALSVEHKSSGEIDFLKFPFYLTSMDGNLYANVSIGDLPQGVSNGKSGYFFLKIFIYDANNLGMAFLAQQPVISAIESNLLKGELTHVNSAIVNKEGDKSVNIPPGKIECVEITDSSHKLREFIKSNASEHLFPHVIKFHKIN